MHFYPAEPLDTIRVQETLHDAVLRIAKALTKRGWQDREDDPFAEIEPGLASLWRAALPGKSIDPATEQPKRADMNKLPKPDGGLTPLNAWSNTMTAKTETKNATQTVEKPATTATKPNDANPTTAAATESKPQRVKASYLAIALPPDVRARLDNQSKTEGESSELLVRKAVLAQFNTADNADATKVAKVDAVAEMPDAVLVKLTQLDRTIDSALSDTVRIGDRLARATVDKG